jgi:hypothetical protein
VRLRPLFLLCLVLAPAGLIGVELFHPAGFTAQPGMYEFLSKPEPYAPEHQALAYPGPEWWFLLHMIQTPLVGLVAVGLWLIAARIGPSDGALAVILAWLSRAATFVFLIYYTALDAIGGFGLGRAMINTEALAAAGRLTADQVAGVKLLLDTNWQDPWIGGVGSFISQTGSWAVFVASLAGALALLLTRRAPLPSLILLVGFGWELQTSHASPHGPIAFALLILSALLICWADRPRVRAVASETQGLSFEELAAERRALTSGRPHTAAETLQREGRDER